MGYFLTPSEAAMTSTIRIRNITRGTLLADRAAIAGSSAARRTGLLKHSELLPGEGLWIVPCECIHTFGMKFSIDVVFLTKKKKVLKTSSEMPKRRIALAIRAHSVLELPAGTLAHTGTCYGDQLALEDCA
jgi:uncharacterized membrane protein (UPF0127 family)